MARKPRRYPPSSLTHTLAARFHDKQTGDLILMYQPIDSTVTVRVPAEELKEPEWHKPKHRRRKVKA